MVIVNGMLGAIKFIIRKRLVCGFSKRYAHLRHPGKYWDMSRAIKSLLASIPGKSLRVSIKN
jgi:hypothetical protein